MKFIPNGVTRSIGRAILQTKKNSPHIFFVGGVIGSVGGTILACRATLKLEENLDEIKHDLEQVKTMGEGSRQIGGEYAEKEYYKDLGYVYGKSVMKLGRLYGPSLALGAVSVAALTGSHIQMTRRNTALTATLAIVSKAYEDYRERVKAEVGEERGWDIYHNASNMEVEKDGKKETVKVANPYGWSPYARFFEESNTNWKKDAETNRIFLTAQQNYLNHVLRTRGHVFLNDVYDALGMERSREGSVVGWIYNGDGDNYIDFGLFEETSNRFLLGLERNVLLDFNVDGVVYDKI
jgi:hypothetical protein